MRVVNVLVTLHLPVLVRDVGIDLLGGVKSKASGRFKRLQLK